MYMRKKSTILFAFLILIASGGWSSVSALDLVPKVDNFIFLLDSSGSMGREYAETGETKIVLAKEVLARINRHIPALGYASALETLAPLRTYAKQSTYNRMAYGDAINTIPSKVLTWGFIGNPTPLGDGLKAMAPLLKNMQGTKALILISDGVSNKGENPVAAAKKVYATYAPDLCIHVISLADKAEGQKTLDAIAALSSCSVHTTINDLQDQDAIMAFAEQVFYGYATDSDKDGVPDTSDLCPSTPQGVAVDMHGCPLDADGDGVPDYMDACPGTAAGVTVDDTGCPLDSDADGVPDAMDECPDTPADFAVDAKGCPEAIVIDLDIEFDLNKADIKPVYDAKLEEVAMFLLHHENVSAIVEGHTDSLGTAAYNETLSRKRAQSVVDYLTTKFNVDPSIITAIGYGESKPIADNNTAEGRQKNRHALIVISGGYQPR